MNSRAKSLSMTRRLRVATVATVLFSFLYAVIAYACPSLEFMGRAPMPLSMGMGMDGENPCADGKSDDCQLVRDQMLPLRVSAFQAETVYHAFTSASSFSAVLPVGTHMFHDTSQPLKSVFHPVFKLQLPISYLVLRL